MSKHSWCARNKDPSESTLLQLFVECMRFTSQNKFVVAFSLSNMLFASIGSKIDRLDRSS